ncbi:MAG: Uma2 family endonuclease [Limnothrix sp. RL_2_0]|nr:Uma2 family endonuclease [Limnothrix sp. RL_2_0]
MIETPQPTATQLNEFLQQPNIEGSPAWEFLFGSAKQKPMPTLFHSRLQRNLVNAINRQTTAYEAIQELRCIVPPLSPVPDIVVVQTERLQEDGALQGAPDWLIEIRSPDQGTLDLQNKILHCLAQGTVLAWLIDIQRERVWVWESDELPIIYAGNNVLPTLADIQDLTVETVIAMTKRH